MATPILDSISKSLALKVFDPVDNGDDGGSVFSKEQRLGYINRAYGRLVRALEVLHKNPAQVIRDYYKTVTFADIASSVAEPTIDLTEPYRIAQLYYNPTSDADPTARASYIKPEEYLDAKLGLNDNYSPTDSHRLWTVINNKIYLLPGSKNYYNPTIFCRSSFTAFEQTTGTDINLRQDFVHLLINMAAQEAMSDKGAGNKFALYGTLIKEQMELFAIERKDENQSEDEGLR